MLTQPNNMCISTKLIKHNKCENSRVDMFSGTYFCDKNITRKNVFTRLISAKFKSQKLARPKFSIKIHIKKTAAARENNKLILSQIKIFIPFDRRKMTTDNTEERKARAEERNREKARIDTKKREERNRNHREAQQSKDTNVSNNDPEQPNKT